MITRIEEIVEILDNNNIIYKHINKHKYKFYSKEYMKDFIQDIYLILLTHPKKQMYVGMYNSKPALFRSILNKIMFHTYNNNYNKKKNKKLVVVNNEDSLGEKAYNFRHIRPHNVPDGGEHIIEVNNSVTEPYEKSF